MNYYIGLVEFEPCELTEIDNGIRRILRENRIHFRAGNKERLYLSRSELGRGLQNVNHKCEKILLNMYYFLDDRKYMCSRKAAILVTEVKRATNLGTIIGFLISKYNFGIDEIVKVKVLIEKQKVELLKAISEKCLHGQLFKALENPLVDVKESSAWLKSGNNSPQSEGLYCYLQDRNLFFGKNRGTCNHCHVKQKSVDHLATQCGRMLYHDYTWRHNEVVRCLHLKFCREFGILSNKKLKTHRVSGVVENSRVCIKVDIPIVTDIHVQCNKPDIVIHDKINNLITIVEVGITSQGCLQTVEVEKLRKYDLLANELGQIYKCKVRVIPYVLTWDGLVTKCHKSYCKQLGVEKYIKAYIQSVVLKRTFESISLDFRRTNTIDNSRDIMISAAVEGLWRDDEREQTQDIEA